MIVINKKLMIVIYQNLMVVVNEKENCGGKSKPTGCVN